MKNFFHTRQLGGLGRGGTGIVAGHQHMHVATHLGCGGERLVGCILEGLVIVFGNEKHGHDQIAPASLSLETSSATDLTLTPARRFGGSSVFSTFSRGFTSAP